MTGEITDATYLEDEERVQWTGVTSDGTEVSGELTKHAYGPDTELSEDAMREFAEELPGTPLYDESSGPAFDVTTVPASVGFDDE